MAITITRTNENPEKDKPSPLNLCQTCSSHDQSLNIHENSSHPFSQVNNKNIYLTGSSHDTIAIKLQSPTKTQKISLIIRHSQCLTTTPTQQPCFIIA